MKTISMLTIFSITLLTSILLINSSFTTAYGIPGNQNIGIVLSETCITLIKNNIDSTCPSYELLLQVDSSNTKVSGEFVFDESGFFHRDTPQLKNSHMWYQFETQPRIIVDPPDSSYLHTIVIMPNFEGKSRREILRWSETQGIKVDLSGKGFAIDQSPKPGEIINTKEVCSIKLQQAI